MLNEDEIGQRTKYAVDMIAECIDNLLPNVDREQVRDAAEKVLSATGVKVTDGATGYLLFVAPGQARALAELAVESIGAGRPLTRRPQREIFDIKKNPLLNAVDVAMFGRMVADAPDLNVDASVQVAHAIGIGKMEPEFDYFTALDDRSPEDNAGAAMIETTEFTSSTMYRYANIDVLHCAKT